MLFTTPYERLTVRRLPWVSFGLAALWLLVYAVAGGSPSPGWEGLALLPSGQTAAGWAGHWLLHESWGHLAVALMIVLTIGPVLEETWGSIFTAAFLAVLLPLAAGAYVLAESDSDRALVGASGMLAGLLTACLLRHLKEGIHYTAVGWWRGPVHARFWLPSAVLIGLWFVGEVLMQHVDDGLGATRGLSYAGQAAGALFGVATAHLMQRFGLEERWLNRSAARAAHPALEAAKRAQEQSGEAAALGVLLPAVAKEPDEPRLVAALCRVAVAAGEAERARAPFVAFIRATFAAGKGEAAASLWEEWSEPLSRPQLSPQLSVSLAAALAKRSRSIEAARLLRCVLDAPEQLSTGLALRIMEVARPVHAGIGIRAAHLALEGGEFATGKREHIEFVVRELEARRALDLDPQLDDEPEDTQDDRSLEIATEEDLRRPPSGHASLEAAVAERSSFEIGTDGSLTGTGSDFELAAPEEPVPDTQPILGDAPADTDPIVRHGLDVAAHETRFAEAKCLEVVPVAFEPARLALRQGDAPPSWLELGRVQALASGAIAGLAERPVIVIDLLLNWSEVTDAPLQVLRLRSDGFDPAALMPDAGEGLEAFRALLDSLLHHSEAAPLPDRERASGRPFARFEHLEAYEREVLLLDR